MDDEWDAGDIEAKFELAMRSNKWEGEDEEEEVKDSWEEVDEEKKDPKKPVEAPKTEASKTQAPKPKPKKSLTEKIEERERKAREDAERKAKEKEEALTPDERRAELLRRQRLQEEDDLRIAMETFGVWAQDSGLDAMMPDTKEEFDQFCDILAQKINSFNKHTEFTGFAEELINRIAVNLSSTSLKKLKTTIENLAIEKSKLEKGDKGKKKGKGKAKLKIEGDNAHLTEYDAYTYDNEYDDFM